MKAYWKAKADMQRHADYLESEARVYQSLRCPKTAEMLIGMAEGVRVALRAFEAIEEERNMG